MSARPYDIDAYSPATSSAEIRVASVSSARYRYDEGTGSTASPVFSSCG